MFILTAFLLMANAFVANSQIRKDFTQRTSSYSPTKKIYNINVNMLQLNISARLDADGHG